MTIKPDFCQQCPINHVTRGYVPLSVGPSNTLVVGEASGETEAAAGKPFQGGAGRVLNGVCNSAGIKRESLSIVNVIGCQPPGNVFPLSREWSATSREDAKAAVAYCRERHLVPALASKPWAKILALGGEALSALTGMEGISRWRGSPLPLKGEATAKVMPTLHPAFLMRQANMISQVVRDIKKPLTVPPENYNLHPSVGDVQAFTATTFAFDLEWDQYGNISMCGLSDKHYHALVVPWTTEYIDELRRIFESAKVLIGQNCINADMKHIEKLGWNVTADIHDTMLMQHLIQPDMRHDLATIASIFTNKVFWKGKDSYDEEEDSGAEEAHGAQWKTWNDPVRGLARELGGYYGCQDADEAFRLYNARDTDATFQAWWPIYRSLQSFGLENIYWNVSRPMAYETRRMGEQGIKIDASKVGEINKKLSEDIARLEITLPEGLRPYEKQITRNAPAPPGTFRPRIKSCKGLRKVPHEKCDVSFSIPDTSLPCPICGRSISSGKLVEAKIVKVPGVEIITPWNSSQQVLEYAKSLGCKEVRHGKTKNPTADKNARKQWGREHFEFTIVDQLKKLSTLRNNFAKEELLNEERIYFNILVHGTAEGRTSSSGRRRGIDPNIQNQPTSVRGIYIPDYPSYSFLDVDWVQGENWLTAWLAQDKERLDRLRRGDDEHALLASKWFNRPVHKHSANSPCTDCEGLINCYYLRVAAKKMGHGLNYGAGKYKIQELLAAEGFNYPLKDVSAGIDEWRSMNRGTFEWQQRTIRMAEMQGYLVNPFGRKRWLQSRDFATKMLAFLPASTLADMKLRVVIAMNPNRWAKELTALNVRVTGAMPTTWEVKWEVHDSLVLSGEDSSWREAARVVKAVMTQPWTELGEFSLDSSVAYSNTSWGDCKDVEIK